MGKIIIDCPHCNKKIDLEEALREKHPEIIGILKNTNFSREFEEKYKLNIENIKKEYDIKLKEKDIELKNVAYELEMQKKDSEKNITLEKYKVKSELEKEYIDRERKIEKEKHDLQLENEKAKIEFERKLKEKEDEIEYYRDYKTRMSTKMVGESLEQYCSDEFNKVRMMAYPKAYFEKDNEVIQGSKGDFVFRNYNEDGIEICSIMFEMKNEMDTTSTKHKNEDFFEKLDKDRKNKNCEYAVLVSMLEANSDFYNQGIAEIYKYDKMYVVRPQNFMSIISLINNISQKTIDTKKELELYKNQHVELLAFEEAFNSWKDDAGKTLRYYSNNVSELKKKIMAMRKTADDVIKVLDTMEKQLGTSSKKIESGTVKKFAKNSPSMLIELKKGGRKN